MLISGDMRFDADDLERLTELVATAWLSAADADWSANAGTLTWSCRSTSDHAVDCVYAPAFFLASRRVDAYPDVGLDFELGQLASPAQLVESLRIASRLVRGVVADTPADVRAVIFRRPQILTAPPHDFLPRAAMELILHAHDVCSGLRVPFEPPPELCLRLREHTRPWPMWTIAWKGLDQSGDPWGDLLRGSGRERR